ncbi:Flp pilus assembly protein CpaB [Altererythrobacter sp. MF3-039]|uniref:Flp pilus assembly protein CpaB n=1 Tax=Altererythrobacter sp. MF3-039 TaxID=3252901 RepID=UPI00390CA8DE
MDRKKLVLLLGALVIAIGTALVARSMFAGAGAPAAEAAVQTGPKVLVAQRTLPTGTIITADALGFQAWPEDLVQDVYFIDGEADMTKLLGTVVRHPVTAGEPVTQGSLVSPGDRGFLAAALGPGMRAVTIPVSAKTGVAGFVFPGDRVDIVLTQSVKGEGQALKASETILHNMRVLATDQKTEQKTVDGQTVVKAFRTVTLEVTPKIAEKVAVAQTIGTLSLSLRSLADNQGELEAALAAGDITLPDNATPEEEERLIREAMGRPIDSKSTYVTGADVSRFQRASKPAQGRSGGSSNNGSAPSVAAPSGQYSGPGVRVTRGKQTQVVPVASNGSRAAAISGATAGFLAKQAAGAGKAAQASSAAMQMNVR